MGDDFAVTITGDVELIAVLDRARSRALPEVEAITAKGALNIKTGWAQRWAGIAHAPALPRAISYDLYHLPGSVRAEIGPDKAKRQGALGNLIEYGSTKNAPIPGGAPALADEAPRYERNLTDLAARLLS